MRNVCGCEVCDYCKAYTQFEMDMEFGGGVRRGNTDVERITNRLKHELNEDMCREFGTGGTTLEQRESRYQPMSGPIPLGRRAL